MNALNIKVSKVIQKIKDVVYGRVKDALVNYVKVLIFSFTKVSIPVTIFSAENALTWRID